jgi:hypothetical protein
MSQTAWLRILKSLAKRELEMAWDGAVTSSGKAQEYRNDPQVGLTVAQVVEIWTTGLASTKN